MTHPETVLILDYGSQYSQLIARRVRELGVYSELHPFSLSPERIREISPKGIILSGSPYSSYEANAPISSPAIFDLGIPVLGICYGLQLMAFQLGGEVDRAARREYGSAQLTVDDTSDLFAGFDGNSHETLTVWMSHGDHLTAIPKGFEPIAHTSNAPICAIRNKARRMYGVQFHPEVVHTPQREGSSPEFSLRHLWVQGGMERNVVCRATPSNRSPERSATEKSSARSAEASTPRWRRSSCTRRSATAVLHPHQQRSDAEGGIGRGCRDVPFHLPHESRLRRCDRSVPGRALRRDGSRAETEDHRQDCSLRSSNGRHARSGRSISLRKGRCTPTSSNRRRSVVPR